MPVERWEENPSGKPTDDPVVKAGGSVDESSIVEGLSFEEVLRYERAIFHVCSAVVRAISELMDQPKYSIYSETRNSRVFSRGMENSVVPQNLFISAIFSDWMVQFAVLRDLVTAKEFETLSTEAIRILRTLYRSAFGTVGISNREILDYWQQIYRELSANMRVEDHAQQVDPEVVLQALFMPIMRTANRAK